MTEETDSWEPSAQPDIILALSYSGGFLGAAVYDQATTTIRRLSDVGEDNEFRMVDCLMSQVDPSVVIVCKAQDLQFIRHMSKLCGTEVPTEVEMEASEVSGESVRSGENSKDNSRKSRSDSNFEEDSDLTRREEEDDDDEILDEEEEEEIKERQLHLLPSVVYKYDTAINRITRLFQEEAFSETERDIVLKFRIDTQSSNMVRAMGALLKYMDSARVGVEYDALNVSTPVSAVRKLILEEMVEIDSTTYRALEIFGENRKRETCWKSSMANDPSRLTLFSICNRCRSSSGKNMLRNWFEHPTCNREVLLNRQKAIAYFVQDCNADIGHALHRLVGKVRSLKTLLKRMRSSSSFKVTHWTNLYESLSSLLRIGTCLREKDIHLTLFEQGITAFGAELNELVAVMESVCDFAESGVENRLVVCGGVDEDLDESKYLYRQLPTILTRVAREEATRLHARTCSVGYVPMVGYLLALPVDYDVDTVADLRLVYETPEALQVKSDRMDRLDEELGDIKMEIIDKETTIMLRLQKLILKGSDSILKAAKLAATLDVVLSLAMTARHLNWCRPTLVDEAVIEARNVVHPLAQIVINEKKFVPNPVSSGVNSTKVKIFTGPNACGKSVYLKQVGVLAFLAHIGSFVPADRCAIGPINRIMTRMYTVDGVLDGMSTFAKDLSQLALALRRANQFSLVIVDEFGKGTMTEVGISLLAASVSHWIEMGSEGCPHLLVSSHFHALTKLIDVNSSLVSFHTLEVMRRGHRLEFQFRLVEGIVDKSFAAHTASQMGISDTVVARANQVYDYMRNGTSLSLIKADEEEERKCNWLEERMDNMLFEFETWDIDRELDSLLTRIEEVLFEEDERFDSTMQEEERTDVDSNYREEEEAGSDGESSQRVPEYREETEDEPEQGSETQGKTSGREEEQPTDGSLVRSNERESGCREAEGWRESDEQSGQRAKTERSQMVETQRGQRAETQRSQTVESQRSQTVESQRSQTVETERSQRAEAQRSERAETQNRETAEQIRRRIGSEDGQRNETVDYRREEAEGAEMQTAAPGNRMNITGMLLEESLERAESDDQMTQDSYWEEMERMVTTTRMIRKQTGTQREKRVPGEDYADPAPRIVTTTTAVNMSTSVASLHLPDVSMDKSILRNPGKSRRSEKGNLSVSFALDVTADDNNGPPVASVATTTKTPMLHKDFADIDSAFAVESSKLDCNKKVEISDNQPSNRSESKQISVVADRLPLKRQSELTFSHVVLKRTRSF